MKKYFVVLMMAISALAADAFAAGKEVTVGVKGMVCSFCAQGIEKKLSAEPAVEKVKVSLNEKRVILNLKEGQDLSDEAITKILTDSGYNVGKIDRK